MISNLHIISSKTLGGAERFCLRLVHALRQNDWEASILLRRGSMLEAQVSSEVPVCRTTMATAWDPWSRWQVIRAIRRLKPELVQTYMGRATRLTRLRRHATVHVARLGGYYRLAGYRHADAWIGNTKGLCDYLIDQGLPAQRVFHIYNFIDLPEEQAAVRTASLPVPDDAWVLLCAARLEAVKGVAYLLSAIAQLPVAIAGRPLHVVILGDGPLRRALRQQAQQMDITPRLHWAGWVTDPNPYYQRADLVVFPSQPQETLGNVILEAWAHGIPLLTTASRGAVELCRHGVDTWCVPCADPGALGRAIQQLLQDQTLRFDLAAAGYQRVRRDFSRRVIVGQYQELYARLTGH